MHLGETLVIVTEHAKSDNGESTEPKIELSETVVSKADDQGLPQDGEINVSGI